MRSKLLPHFGCKCWRRSWCVLAQDLVVTTPKKCEKTVSNVQMVMIYTSILMILSGGFCKWNLDAGSAHYIQLGWSQPRDSSATKCREPLTIFLLRVELWGFRTIFLKWQLLQKVKISKHSHFFAARQSQATRGPCSHGQMGRCLGWWGADGWAWLR